MGTDEGAPHWPHPHIGNLLHPYLGLIQMGPEGHGQDPRWDQTQEAIHLLMKVRTGGQGQDPLPYNVTQKKIPHLQQCHCGCCCAHAEETSLINHLTVATTTKNYTVLCYYLCYTGNRCSRA